MIDRQTAFEIHCRQRRGLPIHQLRRQPGNHPRMAPKYLVLFLKNLNARQKAPAEVPKAAVTGIGRPMS